MANKLNNKVKQEKEVLQEGRRFGYGKYLIGFFVALVLILGLVYGYLVVLSSDRSLPRLTLLGGEVGSKTKLEIRYAIDRLQEKINKSNLGVSIKFNDENFTKSYSELGIKIDSNKTTTKIFNFGKIKDKYPSFDYLVKTVNGRISIAPEVYWMKSPKSTFDTLSSEKKIEPENPKIVVSGKSFEFKEGKNGVELDSNGLKEQVEKCFAVNCKNTLTATEIEKKSNFTLADLEPFKRDISDILNSKYTFQFEDKKVSPNTEQLASFIDLEMTSLNQKLTLSDSGIEEYLKSVAGKFTQKPQNKKVSTVDNSVIDEGKQGTQLNIKESAKSIKEAILRGDKTAELSVTTADPKEELVGPGYTLNKNSGKYIEVNLGEQNLYTVEGDRLLGTYRVSTGKWSMPTPTGDFSINNKDPRAYSQEYNLYMPYWMSFIGSQYGIHELPEWPDGTKEGEGHLGTPVSHGCIRLGRGAAAEVYSWAEIGTPVYVHQ